MGGFVSSWDLEGKAGGLGAMLKVIDTNRQTAARCNGALGTNALLKACSAVKS